MKKNKPAPAYLVLPLLIDRAKDLAFNQAILILNQGTEFHVFALYKSFVNADVYRYEMHCFNMQQLFELGMLTQQLYINQHIKNLNNKAHETR